MATHLIDVLSKGGNVMHTFPISLEGRGNHEDTAYQEKALEAAAFAHVAPDEELHTLAARNHVSRGGQLKPYGDTLDVLSQTKSTLEQDVRKHAYLLWERDGGPEGCDDYYWNCALQKHLQERAYVLWQQNGCREGNADEDWDQARKFEEQ